MRTSDLPGWSGPVDSLGPWNREADADHPVCLFAAHARLLRKTSRRRALSDRFTLGEFFAIWNRPLEPDNVAGLTGKPIVVYVTDNNGVVTLATGDWKEIELLSHREITIQVGTPIAHILNYTWSAH